MTEQEWAQVTTSFTEMFDTLMKIAPDKVNGNKVFLAGTILNQELDRIRRNNRMREVFSNRVTSTADVIQHGTNDNLAAYNAKIERKKQEIHDIDEANFMTLEQKLQASIDRAKREKQK